MSDEPSREHRPDVTPDQATAEARADAIIGDFGRGLITRGSAVRVRDAAERAISGHDLGRSIGKL